MTLPDITATWTWTGDRDLPDWLTGRHHWHHGQPVIHTADGSRTLHDGWLVALWSDGLVTVGSNTVADRVYGPHGLAGRLAALRELARGYCPECGRGDAAPTAADWERERQRADRAEARVSGLERDLRDADVESLELARHNDQTCEAVQRRDTAEAAVARVQALAARWVVDGPPPLGTSIARWWDKRLVELQTALGEPD